MTNEPLNKSVKRCPFCKEEISHIESEARSFKPPRIYHEYHHPKNKCYLDGPGPLMSFDDNEANRIIGIGIWNNRA